jgi:hypothetical protein
VQIETDTKVVADDARIRRVLGIDPKDKELRLSWTELHDALTALQAHKKPIPSALSELDLDIINQRV